MVGLRELGFRTSVEISVGTRMLLLLPTVGTATIHRATPIILSFWRRGRSGRLYLHALALHLVCFESSLLDLFPGHGAAKCLEELLSVHFLLLAEGYLRLEIPLPAFAILPSFLKSRSLRLSLLLDGSLGGSWLQNAQ